MTLCIGMALDAFPAVSETWVLHDIEALLHRGHDVLIVARRSESGPRHEAIERLHLQDRTRYIAGPDCQLPERRSRHAAWRVFGRSPGVGLRALNPLLFGRHATSLRVLAACEPWVWYGEPDVVLAHHGSTARAMLDVIRAGAVRAPLIACFHGTDAFRARPGKYDALFRVAARIVANGRTLADRLHELGCPQDKIVIRSPVVDLSRYRFRQRAQVPAGDRLRLLTIGRLIDVKGTEHAIEAVHRLSQRGIACQLTIVGEGAQRESLQALAGALGVDHLVRMTGALPQEQVRDELDAADIFLAPGKVMPDGRREAFGVVVLEAMAAGLPVIASACGGYLETVDHGRTGLHVPPGDAEAMTDAIIRLMHEPELVKRLTIFAAEDVRSRFDPCRSVDLLESFVREAARR